MKIFFILLLVLLVSLPTALGIPLSDKTALKFTFPVSVEEHNFVVEVAGNMSVERFDFSGDEKMIILELQSSIQDNILEMTVPKTLLGGELTFLLDGNEALTNVKQGSSVTFITVEFSGTGAHVLQVIGSTHLDFFEIRNELDYDTNDGYVDMIEVSPDQKSLIITLFDPGDNGSLSITLPEHIITPFDDGTFVVLIDNEESDYILEDDMMTIPFDAHAEKIEIIGTHVVPEFAQVASLVLATSLIGLVIIKRYIRLGASLVK